MDWVYTYITDVYIFVHYLVLADFSNRQSSSAENAPPLKGTAKLTESKSHIGVTQRLLSGESLGLPVFIPSLILPQTLKL